MKVAVVHIGAHKTGSTTIQAALRLSKSKLAEQGIHYFNDYNRRNQLLSMCLRVPYRKEQPIRTIYASNDALGSASRAAWIKLARHVRRSSNRFTVISEEALIRSPHADQFARQLQRIFDHVVIVAYVRAPISRFPSSIDQRIRGGDTLSDLVRGKFLVPRLLRKLDAYASAFGEGNMVVRNFDMRNLVNESPSADFAAVLSGITEIGVSLEDAGRENASMPAAVTYDLLEENEFLAASGATWDRAAKLKRKALISAVRADRWLMSLPKLRLTNPRLLGHLMHLHADEIVAINRRFLPDQTPMERSEAGEFLARKERRAVMRLWISQQDDAAVTDRMATLRSHLRADS